VVGWGREEDVVEVDVSMMQGRTVNNQWQIVVWLDSGLLDLCGGKEVPASMTGALQKGTAAGAALQVCCCCCCSCCQQAPRCCLGRQLLLPSPCHAPAMNTGPDAPLLTLWSSCDPTAWRACARTTRVREGRPRVAAGTTLIRWPAAAPKGRGARTTRLLTTRAEHSPALIWTPADRVPQRDMASGGIVNYRCTEFMSGLRDRLNRGPQGFCCSTPAELKLRGSRAQTCLSTCVNSALGVTQQSTLLLRPARTPNETGCSVTLV
jgi:hypothetical protein